MLHVNPSDAWLRATAVLVDSMPPLFAPRRVYLDKDCEIFCLVSPEDYDFVTQWRWKWNWDRTKKKRYAIRTPRIQGRSTTIYLHKVICERKGPAPSEAHTIGDHQNGESLDCQRHNLEWATVSQNRRNRKR
jgi:hypothetical protein